MPSGPPAIFPFPRPLDEFGLFRRGVQVGFDGSLLDDNMVVYVVPRYRVVRYPCYRSAKEATRRVDYFHGCAPMPICQMLIDEADFPAIALVGPSGFVGKRIIHIQRIWRRWIRVAHAKRYNAKMVEFGLLLARASRRRSARIARLGEVDPC